MYPFQLFGVGSGLKRKREEQKTQKLTIFKLPLESFQSFKQIAFQDVNAVKTKIWDDRVNRQLSFSTLKTKVRIRYRLLLAVLEPECL